MSLETALALIGHAEEILSTLKSDLARVTSDEGASTTLDTLGTAETMTQAMREALLRERASGAGPGKEESQTEAKCHGC